MNYLKLILIIMLLSSCHSKEQYNEPNETAYFFLSEILANYIQTYSTSVEKTAFSARSLTVLKQFKSNIDQRKDINISQALVLDFIDEIKEKKQLSLYILQKCESLRKNLIPKAEKLLLLKEILSIALFEKNFDTYSSPTILLLESDTLLLKANKKYTFPFRLDDTGSNLLLSNDIVANANVNQHYLMIETPKFQEGTVEKLISIPLKNHITGEQWTVSKKVFINLSK